MIRIYVFEKEFLSREKFGTEVTQITVMAHELSEAIQLAGEEIMRVQPGLDRYRALEGFLVKKDDHEYSSVVSTASIRWDYHA